MQRIASNGPLLCQVNSQWRMEELWAMLLARRKEEWKAAKAKRPMGARLPRLTKIESSAPSPTDIPTDLLWH